MKIHYLIGDATNPIHKPCVIPHTVNDVGLWGSGFVLAVSKKNKEPEKAYKEWYREGRGSTVPFELGAIQIISYDTDTYIANMIAQHDVRTINGVPPVRYDALEKCLESVYNFAKNSKLCICCPRFCAVRSGGDWKIIEAIVQKMIDKYQIETYVYTLAGEKDQWAGTTYENDTVIDDTSISDLFN
jgi:hypothetical protein